MSLSAPRKRQLLSSATSLLQCRCLPRPPTNLYFQFQSRSISISFRNPFKRRKQDSNYLSPASLEKARLEKEAAKKEQQQQERSAPTGDLAPGSIFEEKQPPSTTSPLSTLPTQTRDPAAMATALDPTPPARKRWQRKMVIRDIRGRQRLNKTEKILRTERAHLLKSPLIKTSVKKLYPLARQIAGKPIEEAMVQMRFSKKKAARDVLEHLQLARDQAVVVRGMGLGRVEGVGEQGTKPEQNGESKGEDEGKQVLLPAKEQQEQRLIVEDKKGKKRVVTDPTSMYIDEAWVGRGAYETGSDHRARGQIHRLRRPFTSISVVLKEEKTRIRQMVDREEKRQRKKVWVPLPDRKVTAQRQYCLW